MASEYLKWKYKDFKPDEKAELTAAEKRQNWWHYHKWWVVFAAVAVIGGFFLIRDVFFRPVPDYQVGYVSKTPLPNAVLVSLQARLEELGEDVNGDGRVLVEIFTYNLGFDSQSMTDVDAASTGITRLTVDLSTGRVYCLLLDDPEGFQSRMGALSYLGGAVPPVDDPVFGADDWREMVYRWEDCLALAALDLGTYSEFLDMAETKHDGQEAMAELYIGRRAVWDDQQRNSFAADERLFQALTAGAISMNE